MNEYWQNILELILKLEFNSVVGSVEITLGEEHIKVFCGSILWGFNLNKLIDFCNEHGLKYYIDFNKKHLIFHIH